VKKGGEYMARSQIIKDLVSEKITLESALMRLKVLLYDLDNDEINAWIEKELNGYSEGDVLPKYRVKKGLPKGTILSGTAVNMLKQESAMIPISKLSDDMQEAIISARCYIGISALEEVLRTDSTIGKPWSKEMCSYVSKIYHIAIIDAKTEVSKSDVLNILMTIKTKLLDILMKLEKDMGNLDDLDIFFKTESRESKKDELKQYIINIIYDGSITIGDDNEIENTDFSKNKTGIRGKLWGK
jgi:hypothetical protein